MRGKYHNVFKTDDVEPRMTSIITEPKFAIGQRCILLETSAGNILWDCIAYLDQETIDLIKSKGGLKAIVISHPHYYTAHLDWAKTFDCPVYFAKVDEEWVNQPDPEGRRKLSTAVSEHIVDGVIAVKVRFACDCVLLSRTKWYRRLVGTSQVVSVSYGTRNYSLLIPW